MPDCGGIFTVPAPLDGSYPEARCDCGAKLVPA
jgi:hypothetical protein